MPGTARPDIQDNSSSGKHPHARTTRGIPLPQHIGSSPADLGNVCLRSQADHDVQFLQFDIDGVIVLHKEHLDFLLQDFRPVGIMMLFHSRLVKIRDSLLIKGIFCLEIYPNTVRNTVGAHCTQDIQTNKHMRTTTRRKLKGWSKG